MRVPAYVSIGNWLYPVKELVTETNKMMGLRLTGRYGILAVKKNSLKNKVNGKKVKCYSSKPRVWWD